MTPHECAREQDVLDALASRRWPAGCDDDLRGHVSGCATCADLLLVAGALLDAGDSTVPLDGAELPAASLVWWRAQLRAREDAARTAARPLRIAQGVAALVACAAIVIGLAWFGTAGWAMFERAWPEVPAFHVNLSSATAAAALAHRGVQAGAIAWLVLASGAVYLVLSRE